ncbi:M3 family metallopeptidase [Actinospica durhamensis]|uniref:Dipeptidyl carboxypeptidase n=1 Tax=Actinospica durhamensis TaxID=1508375 RepID=A0A941EQD9_9ACTN|nr:M3 family metallopeptidase [Actinospica durhamensis]MBR7834603.1 M3 family metallopeptidase [Actinospica durhamensis]
MSLETEISSVPDDNPFFRASTLPYQLPPFDLIRMEHYRPAFDQGMADQLAEMAAIANSPLEPDFENTVVAMERSGALLNRVAHVFFNQSSSDTNDTFQEIEAEISPRLAAHEDAIHLDPKLFGRIKALYDARESLELPDGEALRLIEKRHEAFVRAGAELSAEQQERLRGLNAELATLTTTFQRNLLADTKARALVLDDAAELAGLSEDGVAAAAENGKALGHEGKYVLSLKLFSNQSELASLEDREVRRRLLEASVGRGFEANREVIRQIVMLRAERAALLGFPSHAAYAVGDQTAGSVKAVDEMLSRLVRPAVANAREEAEALREANGGATIAAWDWQYYSEKVRKAQYDIDSAELRPYLELESVLHNGVFFAAGKVYGLSFTPRPDLQAYHPDARVFEVFNEDGSALGLFVADFYARESKRGGAWMNELVEQSELSGTKPVVVNNLNIAKPPAGEPTLLTFDEVNTMFHEFGHALHGLFSDVRYPYFTGTRVPRDFVEYPSQVNEMWSIWPEVLSNYARHYQTGEVIPDALVQKMKAAELFGEGFRTVEYLGATLLDWAWHSLAEGQDPGTDLEAFEAAALEAAGVAMTEIPPRYRTGYFAHIFSSGYAAGYYSYIWSEVLDADTVEWFKENGGMLRANGERFRAELLSRGGSLDPLTAFANFRGRAPEIEPLLARRGLLPQQ